MASSSGSVPLRMSCGSTSAGSGPHRRGLISCLHSHHCRAEDSTLVSDEDLPIAVHKLLVGFYEEAFNRLPRDAMPDLLRLLTTGGGGSCLGLLDPVSNIILNTLAVIPKDDDAAASRPDRRRSKRVALSTTSTPGRDAWRLAAARSYNSLYGFLMAYFGCLTKKQAIRYLYRASGNLLLAIMLVQHDLYVVEGGFDAESDRTQAALEWAATVAGHPSPAILAHVMSIRLNDADLALFKTRFSDGVLLTLTVDDVRAIHRTIHMIMSPKCFLNIIPVKRGMVLNVREMPGCSKLTDVTPTANDTTTTTTTFVWGRGGTAISSLQSGVLPRKLQRCLETADEEKHYLKTPCGGADCEYLQSLHMFVNGIIHNLYSKALNLLPTPSGPLMRSILKAGHCYGCMDPLSNIIVNSIWYDTCGCSLSVSERREMEAYSDLLDPVYLLRAQVQSLKGLTKLASFTGPEFSAPGCALELLCRAKCNIANTLLTSSSRERSEKNPFHEAAVAAGHPRPLWLGELHQQLLLMPDERSELLSFITEAQASGKVLRMDDMALRVTALWNRNRSELAQPVRAPQLSEGALRVVSSKRSEYEKRRSQLRPKIEQLLKQYNMTQQFQGRTYKLDTILGVEERKRGYHPFFAISCQVNFMATSDLGLQRTLFFAEFWSPEPRPEFCCPLPYAYAGRCYYGVHSARKIVYPDDAKYIPEDITHGGTSSVDRMLGMDLVYFSPEWDVELAKKLNMLPSEEEEKNKKKKRKKSVQ